MAGPRFELGTPRFSACEPRAKIASVERIKVLRRCSPNASPNASPNGVPHASPNASPNVSAGRPVSV